MMASAPENAGGKAFRALQVIAIAVAASVIMLMIVAIVINQQAGPLLPDWITYHHSFLAGCLILGFASLLAAKKIMDRGRANAKKSLNDNPGKLNIYRTTFVLYLVVMELPVLVAIVLYILTGAFPLLAVAGVILGLMLASLPTKSRVAAALEMDPGSLSD